MKTSPPCTLRVAVLAAGLLSGCGKQEDLPPIPVSATRQPVPVAASRPEFASLKGKWLRPDGGYILELRNVDLTGKLDAGYFNPRSIHVAKAEASAAAGAVKVFIELRDVNYPGSTYTLTYDSAADQLQGAYYQAITKETFPVAFVRVKP